MSKLVQKWVMDSYVQDQDVKNEMREIWARNELGNDNYFYSFDAEDIYCDYVDDEYKDIGTFGDKYPHITKVLADHELTKCWLRFWW